MISSSDILKASILIVDDRDANISLLEQMLRGAGYVTIASTRNSHEVCELHRQNRYSLILLDLQMPGPDGFQVMENLKTIETDGYLPVLVITAQSLHKLRALKAGAKDFVSKPFDLAEVLMRVHNMLEVRLLHLETKRLNDQLQITNEELQSFSYSVSHDLRAPLRHVIGFVELLQQDAGPSLSEKSLRHLTTISQAAKRMGDLVDNLLAFSRLGRTALQKTDVNLDELVRETLGDFQAETKKRGIAWDIHPLPSTRADHALLRMVLLNLVANAVKFTGARAEAKIEIGCVPHDNDETAIFIRDNGAGFDPQYASKLFGVFQRLHSQAEFEGTGIGLANVQRIIRRHGGRVWAEGAVDRGATFYFSIPKPTEGDANER
jgi:light-regulated signal transduction histidine kinase (bacteriophytochrome)